MAATVTLNQPAHHAVSGYGPPARFPGGGWGGDAGAAGDADLRAVDRFDPGGGGLSAGGGGGAGGGLSGGGAAGRVRLTRPEGPRSAANGRLHTRSDDELKYATAGAIGVTNDQLKGELILPTFKRLTPALKAGILGEGWINASQAGSWSHKHIRPTANTYP